MLGKIIRIVDNIVTIQLSIKMEQQVNLVNLHVVFEDEMTKIVGEIESIDQEIAQINIVGEIVDHVFLPGFSKKPSFKSIVRLIKMEELSLILGDQKLNGKKQIYFGLSTIYKNYHINVNINQFFTAHFAVLGNTGSGKSFTVSRLLQNIFSNVENPPVRANMFLFDAYGEYANAFTQITKKSPRIHYKNYTTNVTSGEGELLRIPLWLLGVDDIAQLLGVTTPMQLPIIEKALKLVAILKDDSEHVIEYKNDIISRAIMDILMSGRESVKIRDQIVAILTNFHTNDLNLESQIVQPGYVRTLKQCLFVDKTGKMQEMETVVEFMNQFQKEGLELRSPDGTVFYTLNDLQDALEFALISEGILKSDKVFDYANVLSVRLRSLIHSEAKEYFSYPNMISRDEFVQKLTLSRMGERAQIVNFNINYVDDRMAKAITKILSKLLFDYQVESTERAKNAFHIIIEEAHRYVQNDSDLEILGYNIFDRITKEGRKYGVLLGLITQRPSELSDTAISQCSNFIILRTLHPKDLDYIRNMVPNMSSRIVEQLKILQPGNCIAFGSAFLVPVAMRFEKPNPEPLSNNVNLENVWYQETQKVPSEAISGIPDIGGMQQDVPKTNEIDPLLSNF